jgi:DNA-binding MarR family transcriptional regulator
VGNGDVLTDRERRAWYGFLTMQEDVRRHLNRQLSVQVGISLSDYAVLSALYQYGTDSLRLFELRDLLRWEKTRLTHQVTRMRRRGLVARSESYHAGREYRVALTSEGRQLIERATPMHIDYVRRCFLDVVTPQQLDALAALSAAVLANLETEPPLE